MNVSSCSLEKRFTMNRMKRNRKEKLSFNNRKRLFQQEERKSRKIDRLVSCQQQILNINEKICQKTISNAANLPHIQQYTNVIFNISQDSRPSKNLLNVRKEENNGTILNHEFICTPTERNNLEVSAKASSSTINASSEYTSEIQPLEEELIAINEVAHICVASSEEQISCNNVDPLNGKKIIDENNDNDTNANITNDFSTTPLFQVPNSSKEYYEPVSVPVPPTNSFPVNSGYVFQNINYSVPVQVTNEQAPVHPYVYFVENAYASWQNVQYCNYQQVMYTLPGVYYMFYPIDTVQMPNPLWNIDYQANANMFQSSQYQHSNNLQPQPQEKMQTFQNHLHCHIQNPNPNLNQNQNQNHSQDQGQEQPQDQHQYQEIFHGQQKCIHQHHPPHQPLDPSSNYPYPLNASGDQSQSEYSQFEHIADKQPIFQVDNTIDSLTRLIDLYEVSDEPLELQDLYKNPFFDTSSGSHSSLVDIQED